MKDENLKKEKKVFFSAFWGLKTKIFLDSEHETVVKHGDEEKKNLHLSGSCAQEGTCSPKLISFRTVTHTHAIEFVLSQQKKFFHMTTPYLMKNFLLFTEKIFMHWKLILGIRDTGQFWSMINVFAIPSLGSASTHRNDDQ